MKSLLSFFAVSVIGAATICAQDAPSRLGKDPNDLNIEPTPLPRINLTPTPTPVSKPSATVTPVTEAPIVEEPTAAPAPAPSPTETPVVRKRRAAKPKPTPAPAKEAEQTATPVAATAETNSSHAAPPKSRSWLQERFVAAKIRSLEKEWESSFNDPAVIERAVADDFVGTSPAGELMTKKDLLNEAKENPSAPPKTITRDLNVHFHGADLAVVTGAATQLSRNSTGQVVGHTFRFTDTWVERDGQWKCVASQSMLAPQ